MGQGLTDNRLTIEKFKILVESKPTEDMMPTLQVQQESLYLLNSVFIIYSGTKSSHGEISFLSKDLPCDIHLINLRSSTSPSNEFALFLHRFGVSCETRIDCTNSEPFTLNSYLSQNIVSSLRPTFSQMSLSLLYEKQSNLSLYKSNIEISPMDFGVYNLKLK